jgi:hypothetical protein
MQSIAVTPAGNNAIPGPASAGFASKAHGTAARRLMPRAAVGPRNAPGCAAKRSATSRLTRAHRHCTPVRVSRGGCSCQFGRASTPMIPQRVHTMRGPNVGTGTQARVRTSIRHAGGPPGVGHR